jgi:hypothetical protein
MLTGEISFPADTLKVRLVKNTYAQNLTTDEFVSVVTPITGSTDQTLGSKTVAGGAFDAADPTFSTVPAGEISEGVVIYKDTGNPATSPVIAYIDTITGFPLTTNGGDITIQWDNGAFKIFSL